MLHAAGCPCTAWQSARTAVKAVLVRPVSSSRFFGRNEFVRNVLAGIAGAGALVTVVLLLSFAFSSNISVSNHAAPFRTLSTSGSTSTETQDLASAEYQRFDAKLQETSSGEAQELDLALSCNELGENSWLDLSWATTEQDSDEATCPTSQSSTDFTEKSMTRIYGRSFNPLNGRHHSTTQYRRGGCSMTHQESDPWWRIAFGREVVVTGLRVYGRSGGDCNEECKDRLSGDALPHKLDVKVTTRQLRAIPKDPTWS